MKEIMLRGNKPISEYVYNSQIIKKNFLETLDNKANDIVSGIAGIMQTTEKIKQIIDPDKIYVAQFPKEIIEKIKLGQYDLFHTKSGEILSNIIDKTLPKNRNIVHNIRLVEIDPDFVSKVQELSSNVINMAVQQQLAQISEQLSDINKTLTSIKQGQIFDRMGLVNSGKRQLENALEEPADTRAGSIQNAIKSLEDGRSQLELFLLHELSKIGSETKIPTSKFYILLKCLFNGKFYDSCESIYYDYQESFRSYIEASIYLSMAYNQIGNDKAMLKVFEPVKSLILQSSQKMMLLSGIAVSGKNESLLQWYNDPGCFIKEIDNFSKTTEVKDADVVSIEIKGSKLIEEV